MARKNVLLARFVTLDTSHLLILALNAVAPAKAGGVWEKKEERVRCEMDQIKTTKDHHYQQLARKDLLLARYVALDTSHLLISALNEEAPLKAGGVWEKKEERVRCEMDQIKQQRTTTINNWKGKTYCCTGSSHLRRPTG